MLINCQNCQKIVSSYREVCPHCDKTAVMKKEKTFFGRFSNIFNRDELNVGKIFIMADKNFTKN